MVKQSLDERRQYPRAKRILTVRHRLNKRKGRQMHEFWYLSTTEDMSVNGLLFTSAMPYQRGDILEIEIVMSGVLDIFRGFGRVVRVYKKESGAFYSVAVRYTDIKTKSSAKETVEGSIRKNLVFVRKAAKRK